MAWRLARTTIVLVLMSAILIVGQAGCNKAAAPVAGPPPVANSVGKPLTDDECLVVGNQILQAVRTGDVAALDGLIDWDALSQSCTGGVDAPEPFRKSFLQGIEKARLAGNGLASSIVDAVKKGGTYTLLHSHSTEKRRAVLFRLLLPEGGFNYHDFILARRADGKVKAVDIYIFLTGELFSQTIRRGYIQGAASVSGGLVDRLTGADKKAAKYFEKMAEIAGAAHAGDQAKVLSLYQSFPPEIQKDKSVLMFRLQAAQGVSNDAEITSAFEDFRKEYPNDACIDMISIDYYLVKKQYPEALEGIDRIDRAVQGDPYLQTTRASIHIEQNDLAAARDDIRKALAVDPDMADAYWTLVTISLKNKNFDETINTLRQLRDKLHLVIGDLSTVPIYKEFVESPQYQEWIKEKPATAPELDAAAGKAKE